MDAPLFPLYPSQSEILSQFSRDDNVNNIIVNDLDPDETLHQLMCIEVTAEAFVRDVVEGKITNCAGL